MKAKAISIHSARGGTGKTVIATNLAMIFAGKGMNVALLDLDFRAPSLNIVFSKALENPVKYWLNDYLNGQCTEEQVMINVSKSYNLEGELLIGLANPAIEAIRSMVGKSGAWEVMAVKKLFSLLSTLFEDMRIDCCLLDTSPGIQTSSINSAVSSDLTIVVTTLDSLDLKGTENMLIDLYDALARKTAVLVNKYSPEARILKGESPKSVASRVEGILKHPVIGMIPCFCDVLQQERAAIMALEDPKHPFVKKLEEVAEKLEEVVG
jgi:MinD-like ATPase involved in chromosome partitioning or flagellar assembly